VKRVVTPPSAELYDVQQCDVAGTDCWLTNERRATPLLAEQSLRQSLHRRRSHSSNSSSSMTSRLLLPITHLQ